MSELSPHIPRESLTSSLITQGLGYCCEAVFWYTFTKVPSGTIAVRLGIERKTVQRHRSAFARGEFQCEKKDSCLSLKLQMTPITVVRADESGEVGRN